MKTRKSTPLNVKMRWSQQHAIFKRKYKNEGNLLNGKGEDKKFGTDATQNDQSKKSKTIITKGCQSHILNELNNILPKHFKDSKISGSSHLHDEKDTCLQSTASTGNKNKHIIQSKYAFENLEDENLHNLFEK